MPIATKGSVKTVSTADIEELGSPILLANTYHLYLRPGLDVLREFGGLHSFLSWNGTILTDSGGYQVFSLAKMRKISEEGVEFASHIDGSRHLLTPELSMQVQMILGSDIAMVFDECTPSGVDTEYLFDSIKRTTRWAERSKRAFTSKAALFAVVQGGINEALRERSAQELLQIGFDGYAIGGLSVGETFEDSCRIVGFLDTCLPEDQLRYFMGGAKPHEIVAYVKRGIDLFDCVLPTRNARHGLLYRFLHDDLSRPDFYETVHVTGAKYRMSPEPLVRQKSVAQDIMYSELSRYSLGYIHHLFSVKEVLAQRLLTLANLRFYLELLCRIREGVLAGTL